jgi:hypothetical protein
MRGAEENRIILVGFEAAQLVRLLRLLPLPIRHRP